jgi:endoglucanase
MITPTPEIRAAREALLLEVTQIPTAAGHEHAVMAFIDQWLTKHANAVTTQRDDVGNYLITQRRHNGNAPLLIITAHLDHPAFVVTAVTGTTIHAAFRGGVNDPYFVGADIEVIGPGDERAQAVIKTLDADTEPFKEITAELATHGSASTSAPPAWLAAGCIARWKFPHAEIRDGLIHTDACDDLAAVAAALCAFEEMLNADQCGHVGLLFTVAEEVGFMGAIHVARNAWIPKDARLLCLENSRSFPNDSPIGAGAICRVGDRISVFSPSLTNHLAHLFSAESKQNPAFKWQRKLMAGGGCEASAFACYGYQSTCICLPLGNYHNMVDIDGVAAGALPARVGQEFVSIDDYHSMITMLHIAARGIDTTLPESTEQLMERLYAERSFVLTKSRRDP